MGSLILPTSGSVYVDANSVIYAVEKDRALQLFSGTALAGGTSRSTFHSHQRTDVVGNFGQTDARR